MLNSIIGFAFGVFGCGCVMWWRLHLLKKAMIDMVPIEHANAVEQNLLHELEELRQQMEQDYHQHEQEKTTHDADILCLQ